MCAIVSAGQQVQSIGNSDVMSDAKEEKRQSGERRSSTKRKRRKVRARSLT